MCLSCLRKINLPNNSCHHYNLAPSTTITLAFSIDIWTIIPLVEYLIYVNFNGLKSLKNVQNGWIRCSLKFPFGIVPHNCHHIASFVFNTCFENKFTKHFFLLLELFINSLILIFTSKTLFCFENNFMKLHYSSFSNKKK